MNRKSLYGLMKMISNLEKYRADLESLINDGERLNMAMLKEFLPDQFSKFEKRQSKEDKKIAQCLKSLPTFTSSYQAWYSEALVLVKQLLPDRLADFVKLYEKPKTRRKSIDFENYVIADGLQGVSVTRGALQDKIVGPRATIPLYKQQLNIVKSIKQRFESSLFDIKQLVRADLFDSELECASELNKKGFTRAAGAVAGVVLEEHLSHVCENHRIAIRKKHPGINDFNQLLKDSSVIDTPVWRKIQYLADLRNLCDHKKKPEPNTNEIAELIAGASKITKTLF